MTKPECRIIDLSKNYADMRSSKNG